MSTATTTVTTPATPYSIPRVGTSSSGGSLSLLNVCPDGHLLVAKVVSGGLLGLNLKRCVRCSLQLKTATLRHSCKVCGFHLCDECWSLWMSRDTRTSVSGSPQVARTVSSSSSCRPALVIPACKYGAACYQKSAWHMEQFAHPGDRNYRQGLVSFCSGQYPEFQTLWQLFQFHDRAESGHLTREEFQDALGSCMRLLPSSADFACEDAWREAGGPCTGFVNFRQFAYLAESLGLVLPLGLEKSGATRSCRFRVRLVNNDEGGEEYACSCPCFEPSKLGGGGMICVCGHKLSMHRSDFAEDTLQLRAPSPQQGLWSEGEEGLVQVLDVDLLLQLQALLTESHKSTDNWTRDRGCRLHGVHGCSWACAAKNRCPVPSGFLLKAAYRNQSPDLWHKYCLLKQAIRSECERSSDVEFRPTAVVSAIGLDADLDKDCNEWRCFHGSSPENLRGICSSNFRPTFAGTGATWKEAGQSKGTPLYGFGFYFAERITKADEYTQALPPGDPHEGLQAVLLCRVIGGRTKVVTTNDIDVDGLRGSVFDGPFHSVFGDRVASLGKPYREVVVYDKDQCYPEFLLIYQRQFG
eukprot:TRINITY_DN94083_c0_g1_i1.p1 TRINITY_DN94083_c0_g1~~TRINITY_DN94083_c0_g1_i1.p1  ORF type:complete len:581 (-),score=99.33 TRINITY_DN94083_c0_g1_i1:68-1810(-)